MGVKILECFHHNSKIEFLRNALNVRITNGLHKRKIIPVAVAFARGGEAAGFAVLQAASPSGVETTVTFNAHRDIVERSGVGTANFQNGNALFLEGCDFLSEPLKPLDVMERIQFSQEAQISAIIGEGLLDSLGQLRMGRHCIEHAEPASELAPASF